MAGRLEEKGTSHAVPPLSGSLIWASHGSSLTTNGNQGKIV